MQNIKIIKEDQTTGQFIVGGHVRDTLLGRESHDLDYVIVGSSVEEMLAKGYKLVGKDFPVFIDGDKDLALARRERKIGKGYQGFECDTDGVTLKDDLARRDLTINSIAMVEEGVYYDPFNGIEDLENKILRHTTEAFKEDPVRVLRIARFYARYEEFSIAEETKELVLELRDELTSLTKERVTKELLKAMSERRPELFFIALNDMGVLDILFPEIYAMVGCEHNNEHHLEGDVFNHTMMVLSEAAKLSEDLQIRFGALYHDIGKPYAKETTGVFHSHSQEEVVNLLLDGLIEDKEVKVEGLKQRLNLPNKIMKTIRQGALYHHDMHRFLTMSHKGVAKKFFEKGFPSSPEDLERLFLISKADSCGRLVRVNGEVVSGAVESDYTERLFNFMINSFIDMKKVSAKPLISSTAGNGGAMPSIQNIKDFIHQERIAIFTKHKHLFFNPNNYVLIKIEEFNGASTNNLIFVAKTETEDEDLIEQSLANYISKMHAGGTFVAQDDLFKFDNGFKINGEYEFVSENEFKVLSRYITQINI